MSNPIKTVDRNRVNSSNVQNVDPQKSGFNLSFDSYNGSYQLGKLHVTGAPVFTMPGDKIQGNIATTATFNRLVTPMISKVNVSQHTFYLPLRALDRTFEDAMSPSKLNGLSASWSAPMFTLKNAIKSYLRTFADVTTTFGITPNTGQAASTAFKSYMTAFYNNLLHGSASSSLKSALAPMYLDDWVYEYEEYLNTLDTSVSSTITQGQLVYNFLQIFVPIFGQGSLLDVLGYNYLRASDFQIFLTDDRQVFTSGTVNILQLLDQIIDDTKFNEYAIRMYYAVWYHRYRVDSVESKSSNLIKPKDFASSSIVEDTNGWKYLITRYRSWGEDIFTTSQIDDICRHVYAPIINNDGHTIDYPDLSYNYKNVESDSFLNNHNISAQLLSYTNIDGNLVNINCPLPARVNDYLLRNDVSSDDVYGLDLLNLRQAQNLERYLKKVFYFGDEYIDYTLAQYGSKISDNRINFPELVGASINEANVKQEIASLSTESTEAGTRTATATVNGSGDSFSFFSEEFGIMMTFVSFMPTAQYAGVCPQHMMYKQIDFPLPVFANNNEEFGRIMEIASSGFKKTDAQLRTFGHYPYAHAWRGRVNEVHGHFTDSMADYTFRRFFGMDSDNSTPKLNASFLHCKPNLGMFADQIRLEGQLYGCTSHNVYVERVLPVPVEVI